MSAISPFEYQLNTRLVFGPGSSRQAGAEAAKLGATRVMVVLDPGVARAGVARGVMESLEAAGLAADTFDDVASNPHHTSIDRLGHLIHEGGFDLVVGVGGGSALDTAKSAAVVAANGGSICDYEGINTIPRPGLPVIGIPTTAGTGAEVTISVVVSHVEKRIKLAARSFYCQPRLALLDPDLLATLPTGLAAMSGIDALSHAVEGYLSVLSTAMSDTFALRAIGLIGSSLERFVADRSDPEAAGKMLLGSTLAGMGIVYSLCGAAHAIAHAVGGRFDVHHGLACGILLAPVMRFNMPACEERLGDIARALGVPTEGLSCREAAERAVQRVDELRERVGLPARFQGLRVTEDDIEIMARRAHGFVGPSPRSATYDDVVELFRQVL